MPRGEGIKPISSLFEKYKQQLIAPQKSIIKTFCEVVDDLYGLPLKESMVEYSVYTKTISLKTPGPLRTEILLHKEEILTHLQGRLGVKSAPKIIR